MELCMTILGGLTVLLVISIFLGLDMDDPYKSDFIIFWILLWVGFVPGMAFFVVGVMGLILNT